MTTIQDKQPEDPQLRDFLRLCLAAGRDPDVLVTIKSLSRQTDWQSIWELADNQFILPLIYRNLHGSDILPSELEKSLRDIYLNTAKRNLAQLQSLKKLLVQFDEEKIECVTLKGISLAIGVYGNIASRPCRDIDLLFHHQDIPKILAITQLMGYQIYGNPISPENILQFENEILLYNPDEQVFLEVHWSLFDSPYYQRTLDLIWFWEHCAPVSTANITILSFCPEANLIYLCAHLVLHHRGNELLWMNDISELIYRFQDQIDWNTVIDKVSEFHLILPLRQILPQIASEWNTHIPENVLQVIRDYPLTNEETHVFKSLTNDCLTPGKLFWIDFKYLNGFGKKINFVIQMLFPSADYMKKRYGITKTILTPFYYIYRWWLGIASLFTQGR